MVKVKTALIAGVLGTTLATGTSIAFHGGVTRAHAAKHYNIVLIAGIASDPFYITMGHGAAAQAKTENASVQFTGSNTEFSPATQLPFLNAAIAQKPDLILIAPTDKAALQAPIQRAIAAGIPVILVDTTLNNPGVALTTISSDNVLGGKSVADALAGAVGKKGKVAVISVAPGISTTDQRVQGFNSELAKYPRVKSIGVTYATDSPTKAATIFKGIATANPDLVGVFATNTNTGSGVAAAAKEVGLSGKLKLVEFDAEPAEVQALKQGTITALVSQDPYSIGSLAVRYGVQYLNGNHKLLKHYGTGEAIITKSNISDPSIKRFLYSQ